MPEPIIVKLTAAEFNNAAMIGCIRRITGIYRDLVEPYGKPKNVWETDVLGAAAEQAVAKLLRVYWPPVATQPETAKGDLAYGIEVRQTKTPHGCLMLHRKDRDEAPYVLVRGKGPDFEVVGWMFGIDGKQDRFWRTDIDNTAYLVPAQHLTDIRELQEWIHTQ